MNIPIVCFVLSLIGSIISASMFFPALWALWEGTPDAASLFRSAGICLFICAIGALSFRPEKTTVPKSRIGAREAFAIVSLAWVIASVIGSVPYLDYGTFHSFPDAFFEAMSGFTTTGASVLCNIEAQPHGILLWRALTHWLGGMGIIVLGLTILPFIGGGGMELFKAESPTPIPEKLTPRLQQTAVILWLIYLGLTVLQICAMMLCGTSFYEGITHAFATLATGGFSIYNDSVAHWDSPLIEWVITIFTFLAGVNFSLHFLFLRGDFRSYSDDDEFKWYACIVLTVTAAITLSAVWGHLDLPLSRIVRHAAFQTVTLITTTGFAVTDTLRWPYFVQMILLTIMLIGGCAGSTGGGMKVLRAVIMWRSTKNNLIRSLQPKRILCLRINGKPQKESVIHQVLVFFIMYMLLLLATSLFITTLGIDPLSAFSGSIACLSNVGPGLGQFGPISNYASVPAAGKIIFSFAMLAGRLEILTVLILFMPSTWRR